MPWANVPRTKRMPSEGNAQIRKPQGLIEMSLNYTSKTLLITKYTIPKDS